MRVCCEKCKADLVKVEIGSSTVFYNCPNGHGGMPEEYYLRMMQAVAARRLFRKRSKEFWEKVPNPPRIARRLSC
jgi:hypothetical protein